MSSWTVYTIVSDLNARTGIRVHAPYSTPEPERPGNVVLIQRPVRAQESLWHEHLGFWILVLVVRYRPAIPSSSYTCTRERTLLPEISQDHRTCTERSAKNSVNTNAAHLVECNTLDRHRLRSWHEGLEHVSGSRNPTPGLNTPIGATGCHLIVSRNTASTYGNDARSSKSGSRCRPTTRSISACARCWTSGWFIMR